MSIKQFAQNELDRLVKDDDPMQREVNKDIMAIIELFASQGHSGFSAGYTIGVLYRLLNFQPLTPLTGDDDEWGTLGGSIQNRRCSSVFKDSDGAYDVEAVTTHYAGDSSCFCARVRYNIRFPYMPGKNKLVLELPAEAVNWSSQRQEQYAIQHRNDSEDMGKIARHLFGYFVEEDKDD